MADNGIYDMVMEEIAKRNTYNYETYEPYFICSYVMHNFNLVNQKKKILYINENIENMRLHLLLIAPPGSMKSHYLNTNGNNEFAVFKNTGCNIQRKQSMTEASFVGSVSMNGGAMIERDGVAKVHANDIISIDEFNGLMSALNTQTNNQFESQLLAALDSGNINKDLAGGSPIEYTTNCTIWTGIQPSRLNMEGGLGRRLCHIVCTPTREDNDRLKRIMHESYGKKPNTKNMRSIWNNIKDFNRQIPKIENITMHEDLLDFYDKHDLYSYETTLFDRIAIAYAIAKDGAKTDIEVSLKDKELINIFKNQVKWRQQTYKGVDFVIIRQVLELNGNNMPTAELVSQCRMYGWNIQQVHKIIREMEENHIIRRRGSRIEFA